MRTWSEEIRTSRTNTSISELQSNFKQLPGGYQSQVKGVKLLPFLESLSILDRVTSWEADACEGKFSLFSHYTILNIFPSVLG